MSASAAIRPDTPLNPWLEDRLWKLGADGPVLDVGCGRGYWLERIGGAGLAVVGVEPDVQRARLGAAFAPVAAGDGTRLPLASSTLGLVWCIHVLHHLPDPAAALAEFRRVLRPGGHLILAETVDDNPIVRIGRRIHPEWDGVHIHSRFTGATLLGLVAGAGFDVVDRRQHSLVSFAAWGLPAGGRRAWNALARVEGLLPASTSRWGAHVECVARAAG
ncbi:MAG TPA: class I SAM-dependent methyltransferase [Acidimicrobiales bacterium]|nr:class I SAM-dependent methyltransferase [Acidimicrobiales bacterium]